VSLLSVTITDRPDEASLRVSLRQYPGRVELGGVAWERIFSVPRGAQGVSGMLRAIADEVDRRAAG
jgi:hypothetical protein